MSPQKEYNQTFRSSKRINFSFNETNRGKSKKKISTSSTFVDSREEAVPSKEQALILHCVDGLSFTDYVTAIGEMVAPTNVLFSSRISNNRVCVYLSKPELVDEIVDNQKCISIGKSMIPIEPLVKRKQPILISNVAPTIPNYVLQALLDKLGTKICAPISILRAPIVNKEYSHVLSSTRKTYIDRRDAKKLPRSVKLEYENTIYYIYPSAVGLDESSGEQTNHLYNLESSINNNNNHFVSYHDQRNESKIISGSIGMKNKDTSSLRGGAKKFLSAGFCSCL
ncbi:hypothetical protein TKK_0013270 [Trichogramma kaykai]|uniref:Uncharacterized protein n=1 Tax=Trichogramma kaykai TaxID=54128 RepID=A0ABD2WJP5_9HYME